MFRICVQFILATQVLKIFHTYFFTLKGNLQSKVLVTSPKFKVRVILVISYALVLRLAFALPHS